MSIFNEIGKSDSEIKERIDRDFKEIFFGSERIYFENGADCGYMVDTGNNDVRTEGQSYGMMIAVQLDRKDIFDKIWNWTKTYMYLKDGETAGYFGWSAELSGKLRSTGAAPDGEEFFVATLILASNRWGDGTGIFNYSEEAKSLLRVMVHNANFPMFNPENKLIKFTPNTDFSDPSYHLPHFYELYAKYGNPEDAEFFRHAEKHQLAVQHRLHNHQQRS
ncbi:hypothetical protein FACS189490_07590 [Clostridia bacterium]|nr:hypothetical protein FACS189490_07590 [Clostridia bacterium]